MRSSSGNGIYCQYASVTGISCQSASETGDQRSCWLATNVSFESIFSSALPVHLAFRSLRPVDLEFGTNCFKLVLLQ